MQGYTEGFDKDGEISHLTTTADIPQFSQQNIKRVVTEDLVRYGNVAKAESLLCTESEADKDRETILLLTSYNTQIIRFTQKLEKFEVARFTSCYTDCQPALLLSIEHQKGLSCHTRSGEIWHCDKRWLHLMTP